MVGEHLENRHREQGHHVVTPGIKQYHIDADIDDALTSIEACAKLLTDFAASMDDDDDSVDADFIEFQMRRIRLLAGVIRSRSLKEL